MELGATRADDVHLRARMVRTGCRLTLAIAVVVTAWSLLTWDDPRRTTLLGLAVGAALSALVIDRLPARRIAEGAYGDAFFLAWSTLDVAFVVLAAWADGGVGSPAILLLFLALIFAALAYPRWMVVVVSAESVLSVLVLAYVTQLGDRPTPDPVFLIGLVLTLAIAGVLCATQAAIHQEQREALTELSFADPLTGCLNRRGFSERFAREVARSGVGGVPLALLQFDLDDFKAVNDRRGHAAGDELLTWVAGVVREQVRPGDAVGRLGGDEFAVLLPDVDAAQADRTAARLRDALAERVGASIGVAVASGTTTTPDDLHRRADEELYEIKRRRRGAIEATAVALDDDVPVGTPPAGG